MPHPLADRLTGLVARRAPAEAASWLAAQLEGVGKGDQFVSAFSAAGRRLGTAAIALRDDERLPGEDGVALLFAGRGLDEAGRAALLLARSAALKSGHLALASEVFYRGEVREKQALLRALPLLPEPAQFLDLAVEACRSSVQTLFEAIACENPYPADWFSQEAFNQLVLKALFIEVSVNRIAGLARRADSELARMATGYGSERRVAGRRVPADIDTICTLARRDR